VGGVVVKVGGSLFDLPDLGVRLAAWLETLGERRVVLVPGGGPTTDVIRGLDRVHGLGEGRSHWLALRALTLNAHFLAGLLAGACVVGGVEEAASAWDAGRLPVLDAFAFCREDERRQPAACLPCCWDAGSDAVAARFAVVSGARRLVLLKSADVPAGLDWTEAGRCGLVDLLFASIVEDVPGLAVEAVNLRTWPRRASP
jgi:aspartokinase-like uncharacterized kinase